MPFNGRRDVRATEAAIPPLLKTLWREVFSDHALVVSAGLAYYALFGIFPAMAAAAAIWSRLGDLDALRHALNQGGDLFPKTIVPLLDAFLGNVPRGLGGGGRAVTQIW